VNYQFGDRTSPESRARQIRSLFVAGSTIQEHTEHCIQQKVWTQSEIRGMAAIQARNEVRDALGYIGVEGVPFAGPTGTHKEVDDGQRKRQVPVWRQMAFWSKRDFDYNFTAYRRRADANQQIAENIAQLCRERFGQEPIFLGEEEATQ
jgi:hypothetical protein